MCGDPHPFGAAPCCSVLFPSGPHLLFLPEKVHPLTSQAKQVNPKVHTAALFRHELQDDFILQAKKVGADEVDIQWSQVLDQPQAVKKVPAYPHLFQSFRTPASQRNSHCI